MSGIETLFRRAQAEATRLATPIRALFKKARAAIKDPENQKLAKRITKKTAGPYIACKIIFAGIAFHGYAHGNRAELIGGVAGEGVLSIWLYPAYVGAAAALTRHIGNAAGRVKTHITQDNAKKSPAPPPRPLLGRHAKAGRAANL